MGKCVNELMGRCVVVSIISSRRMHKSVNESMRGWAILVKNVWRTGITRYYVE